MRFMIIVKANKSTEAGVMPSEELLTKMGKYNEELVKAGILRQVFEAEDFGTEFTPELREQEERLRAQMDAKNSS